ncbi:MAG: hypothetical protein A2445_03405 [Candidatus Jacksonbacteria bacterium RIFOXYC2_FULL_44_29]|nr:MAG: hypothetical protein UW45_C0035G0012 [Parcubacteria group bacterium GW2011_GWC2_44_22]OGY77284.1 MAG: hypothetical protein A2295_05000 [Candidatus Jacksonbacteria bacterium RIFOXYB2_FULL_44_15]OGY78267.1 MAG: hypothetical protein A2445_03405 [Candidatus Jacksonbacteria bacterium RIFOXYC2_FULL_44_29]OGY78910.1 MAG: hypothetical protein A2550_05230 [Candidatus Jacksonbacteria bacterium RIFOXYD2_FULL_43_21]
MPFMINILSTILPPATRRNAAIITIYSAVIGALFLITNVLFKTKADANVLDLTAYTPTSTPAMIIMVILMVWIFFAGLALLAVYGIFISHQAKLQPAAGLFLNFYLPFILWLAMFLSLEFSFKIFALIFEPAIEPGPAIVISLAITVLINTLGVVFLHHYLGSDERFGQWLKKLIGWPKGEMPALRQILWGVLGYASFVPIFLIGAVVNNAVLQLFGQNFPPQAIIEFSWQNRDPLITGVLLIAVVAVAPFFEEIIMRGLVFRGLLKRFKPPMAMIISGLIFASFHFSIFAFLPIAIIGTLFAWLYHRTGQLFPSIIAHGLFNGFNFMIMEIMKSG